MTTMTPAWRRWPRTTAALLVMVMVMVATGAVAISAMAAAVPAPAPTSTPVPAPAPAAEPAAEAADGGVTLKSLQAEVDDLKRAVAADPKNGVKQLELSKRYEQLGEAQAAEGELAAGLANYLLGIELAERLASSSARNAQWQFNLSYQFENTADVQLKAGNRAGALKSYQTSLRLRDRLATSDPANVEWQRALAVACGKLGQLGSIAGSAAERRALLERGLSILRAQQPRQPAAAGADRVDDADNVLRTEWELALRRLK